MAAVWYIGRSDIRSISAAQWAAAGVPGVVGSVWDAGNGWSLPKESFNGAQLLILGADVGFNINGTDGPRPGDVDLPDETVVADRAWVASQLTSLQNDLLDGTLVSNLRDYGAGHLANVQRERISLGGVIGTSGKAVAAIRVDHNNKAFNEILLPMLIARDIPASMCQFVNVFTPDPSYTNDDSTGYSWTNVQNNCNNHGIEVWNHSWTHTEVSTQAGYEREIIDSKLQLEAMMPKVRVKGFMVPGVTGNNWGNFSNNLSNMDVWHTTEAGRLIMESHASANGGGAQLQALNTGSTLGWQSRQIDNDTVSSTQINIIKSAQAMKSGVITMIHPIQIDRGAGYITSAVVAEILDYMVAERDAGRLEILTITGMMHADTERTTRNNLIRDPGFTTATTYYVGTTGYTFAGGVATGNGTVSLLGQNVNLSGSVGWAQGSTRMCSAKFQATAGAVVRLRVYDLATPSNFDVTKDVTLPASSNWVTVRKAISIPTNGIANLRLDFGRVSGGALNVKEPAIEAV